MHLALLALLLGPAPASAEDAERGERLYTAKCMACHGRDGKGDGPAARALPRPPPDMTVATFWKDRSDPELRSAIRNGIPGGIMRSFPMSDDKLTDLIAYLRSLAPAEATPP